MREAAVNLLLPLYQPADGPADLFLLIAEAERNLRSLREAIMDSRSRIAEAESDGPSKGTA